MRGAEMLIYPTAIGWESSDTQEEGPSVGCVGDHTAGTCRGERTPVISVNRTGMSRTFGTNGRYPVFGETVLWPVPKVSY